MEDRRSGSVHRVGVAGLELGGKELAGGLHAQGHFATPAIPECADPTGTPTSSSTLLHLRVESAHFNDDASQSRSCMPIASKVAGGTVIAGVSGVAMTTWGGVSGATSINNKARCMISRKIGAAALLP